MNHLKDHPQHEFTTAMQKIRFAILFALCALFFASAHAQDDVKPDEGILMMEVTAYLSTQNSDAGFSYGFLLKNIQTGKIYGNRRKGVNLIVVPEGVYCIDTITLILRGMGEASYCTEPYIKVTKGKLNNAGHWRFELDQDSGTIKLIFSAQEQDKVLDKIKTAYPEYFN